MLPTSLVVKGNPNNCFSVLINKVQQGQEWHRSGPDRGQSSSTSLGTSLRIKSPSDSVLGLGVGTLVTNLRVLLSRFRERIFSVLFLFKGLYLNSQLFYSWEDAYTVR